MNPEVTRPVPKDRPAVEVAAEQPNEASLLDACDIYIVMLISKRGAFLRKPYVSLHGAQRALQPAQDRGQPARLVLCRLEPITVADLGEVAS